MPFKQRRALAGLRLACFLGRSEGACLLESEHTCDAAATSDVNDCVMVCTNLGTAAVPGM
jgi:hypothetical protein